MHVGVQMVFQSYGYPADVTDGQVYREEIELAQLADAVGFHSIWPVEHHFEDYSFCPDNVVFLSNMAARTSRIKLGTGAVIMPWNNPLRVAEKIALLDELSEGRVLLGMGRGLARRVGSDGDRGARHRLHRGRWAVLPATPRPDSAASESIVRRPHLLHRDVR